MRKYLQKGIIALTILMMTFSSFGFVSNTIDAQEKVQLNWEKNNDFYGHLNISIKEEGVTRVVVMIENHIVEEMTMDTLHDVEIARNGTYTIYGYNQDEQVLFKGEKIIDEFKDLVVKENNNQMIDVLSRNAYSNYVEIEKDATKTKLDLTKSSYGFTASFSAVENGAYQITTFDMNNQKLNSTSILVQSVANVNNGSIEIKTVEDIKRIVEQPNQSFVLMNDIELTDNILSEVIFSGELDGNGYTIKGSTSVLFKALENAKIKNVSVQGGTLAKEAKNTSIENSGFYVEVKDKEKNVALLEKANNVTINNSYVLANVEGKEVAGFILEGTGSIQSSYVSGYLKGNKVYGFGKEVEVKDSYISASQVGEEKELFTTGKIENSFYDAQINNVEETEAQAYTTKELTSEALKLEHFTIQNGYYPQIKAIDTAKDKAKEMSLLSAQALVNAGNLSAYENNATLPNNEEVEWSNNSASLYANRIQLTQDSGEVYAYEKENDGVINRFALNSVKTISEPTVGVSTTQATTQITYPTVYGNYYKVQLSAEAAPTKPVDHKAAIEAGWKIVYWSGVNRESDLAWNTKYTVYTYGGTNVTSKEVTTNKQSVNGTVILTGNYALGSEVSATISGLPSDVTGTMYVESCATLDGTWSVVTKQKNFVLGSTLKFTPNDSLYYQYLRARFVVDTSLPYSGEFITATSHVLARALANDDVKLVNKKPHEIDTFSIGDKLSANIIIGGKEKDVTYAWYHETDIVNAIATGTNYTLQESDIGKKIFVIATAKENSDVKGSAKSTSTKEVKAIKHKEPTKLPELVGTAEDTMFTIKMDVSEGLYQFKVVNTKTNETMVYPIIARAGTNTVIMSNTMKIEANSTYNVYVRRIGEYGYENSDYSADVLTVETNKKSVSGDVKLSGKMIYGEKISASVTTAEEGQTGQFVWYRVTKEGSKEEIASNANKTEYTLAKEDINTYIEVAYIGTEKYANEVTTRSDLVSKAKSVIPTANLTIGTSTDTTVNVELATESSKNYIIGYSKTENGVPTEYKEDNVVKVFNGGATPTLEGFNRDTQYYLFVRFDESDTESKSAWIESSEAVSFKTQKTTFTGSLDIAYENTSEPMRGQRIDAKLKENNTNKGIWKWTKIANDSSEIAIFDYTLSDNKESTYYIVPTNEEVGVTYKVEFIASSGYDGSTSKMSEEVVDFALPKYNAPSADNINLSILSDTSLSATIVGVDGQYRFRYKKESDENFTEIEKDVYADAEVAIEGLDRNTTYVVQAKQIGDAQGAQSDWSATSAGQKTEKTEIAGYVSIESDASGIRNGAILTAEYMPATYTPNGIDTGGSWSWYRNGKVVTDAKSDQYKLTSADVGAVMKVVYTSATASNFKGTVFAETVMVGKAYASKPKVTSLDASSQDISDSHMIVSASGINYTEKQDMYYLIQNAANAVPNAPTVEEFGKWKKVTDTSLKIHKDANNKDFVSKNKYTLYLFSIENADTLSSDIASNDVTIADHKQTGTIAFTGKTHVGKEYTATLKTGNNVKGTWRWYYSNTNYGETNPTLWTEIKEGFYPTTNSEKSTLTVPDGAKGKYLKAEFVADVKEGYEGTIVSSRSTTSVTKTYTEKLTISGKGYSNEKITVTLSGSDRKLSDDITKYIYGSRTYYSIGYESDSFNAENNTFTATILDNSSTDGFLFKGRISTPDRKIYTKEDGADIGEYLYSSSEESILYNYGVKISNAYQFREFMMGTGNYSNRSGKYVITENIDMSAYSSVKPTTFSGSLNGDFHTIQNLKNIMFTDNSNSTIMNLFIAKGSIVNNTADTGLFSTAISTNFKISQVYIVNFNMEGAYNAALFAGKYKGNVIVERSGSAGGSVSTRNTHPDYAQGQGGATISGVLGWGYTNPSDSRKASMTDISNINTELINRRTSGDIHLDGCGALWGGGTGEGMDINKSYVASSMALPWSSASLNQRSGILTGVARSSDTLTNSYYDKNLIKKYGTYKGDPFDLDQSARGKDTSSMVGTALSSSLGTSSWTYKEGFYPRLKWILEDAAKNSPDTVNWYNIYAASRQAFTSIDGKTTSTDLANGIINGTIQIPDEFLKSGFSIRVLNPSTGYESSSVLYKTSSNSLVPVGRGAVRIEVSYNGVKNTFDFTSNVAFSKLSDVTIGSNPTVGSDVIANSSNTDVEYKWYRRLTDETPKSVIDGAVSSVYIPTYKDAGNQIQVEISRVGYGTIVSNWSNPVKIIAPTMPPSINNIGDSTVLLTGQGGAGTDYEYAYAESTAGEKAILAQKGVSVDLNGLSRNKKYFIFSRMAAGEGYDASAWGPSTSFTTLKTDIVGDVQLESTYNNGAVLKMSVENTNEQTGTWKMERLDPDTEDVLVIIENSATAHSHTYMLKPEDVGKKIRVTFVGTTNFTSSQTSVTPIIKKAVPTTPNAPTKDSVGNYEVTMTMPNASTKYDIGYREVNESTMKIAFEAVSGVTQTISSLKRNTAYNVYIRKAEDASNEASAWSNALTLTTDKTTVVGDISLTGTLMTRENITFNVADTNDQKGMWKLERMKGSAATTISPSSYQVDENTRALHYEIRPGDATYTLKATFTGTTDYQGSIDTTTTAVDKATPTIDGLPSGDDIEVVSRSDQALTVKVITGAATYQFGYAITGSGETVQLFETTANAGKTISISGLLRNEEYDLYIREAAKTGYNPSAFVKVKNTEKTGKTTLNGHVTYKVKNGESVVDPEIGSAKIGYTYIATYEKGSYTQSEDDTDAGTWQWYVDGKKIEGPNPNPNPNIYTVEAMIGTPEVSVRYLAKEESNFKEYQEAKIGALSKAPHGEPNLPTVEALGEDGKIGSQLKIVSKDDTQAGIYWYVQQAKHESVPELITAEEAKANSAVEGKWFASQKELNITLKPNVEYIVYAAKLEDLKNSASSIVSQRAILTQKDDLTRISAKITEANEDTSWKVLQNKEVRVDCGDEATTGVWKYYVSNDVSNDVSVHPAENSWKIVNSEVRQNVNEGKTDTYAYTNFQVPLKYIGYKLRVVYTGNDGYEGTISYTSDAALAGTLISGTASVTAGSDVTVGEVITTKYITSEEDEKSGYWRWYRSDVNTGTTEMILNDKGDPHGVLGETDSYTPSGKDVDKKIYAVFNAQEEGQYTGSVRTDLLDSIQRAAQNKPSIPTCAQVNGTEIQMGLPSNYFTHLATTPDVILGYKEKDSAKDIKWLTANKNDSWIKDDLKAKTTYEVYAKFERTSEFYESEISLASDVTTGNESFNRNNLKIDEGSVASGQTLHATFTGSGFDQGYFKMLRSDASVIAEQIEGTITEGNKISMSYVLTNEDIGANIIVRYVAKEGAKKYGGYVEKSTTKVTKPVNTTEPTKPILTTIEYSENTLQANISSEYEYVLTTSEEEILATSGDWKKLTNTGTGIHTFTDLDVSKTYYLHARLAETVDYVRGEKIVSDGVKPWERGRFTIAYEDVENNTNPNPRNYDELSEDITLVDPSKKGYTFIGWTFNKVTKPSKEVIIRKHSTGNKSFTANWTINNYKITFECNNGSTIEVNKDFNEKLDIPTEPTKEGNKFVGWYKDATLLIPWDFEKDVVEEDTSLYAKWEPKTYSATFQGNGGSTPLPISGKYENTWPTLPTSVQEGYTFEGWFTSVVGGDKVETTTTVPANNVTYFAQWSPVEYTIEYVLDEGTLATEAPTKYTIKESVNLVQPTKPGYEFEGWTYDGQKLPLKSVNIALGSTGNRTFVANWKQIDYRITYDLDGGKNSLSNPSSYKITDEDITLQIARKENHVFTGWTYLGELTPQVKVVITKGSRENKEFKANWETANATVNFNSQGGSDIKAIDAKKGSTIIAPETPIRTGYTFTGWYKTKACAEADLWDFKSHTVASDETTLYAGWKINTHTITFANPEDASANEDVVYDYGQELQTKQPTFKRTGYRFDGWLDSEGKLVPLTNKVKASATYTASWKVIDYNITYVLDGGINHKDNPATYTIESNEIMLKTPYKENCVFKSWTPSNTITTGTTGSQVFTATWEDASYSVVFVSNGGSVVKTLGAKANAKIEQPDQPTKVGYNFIGWYKDKELATSWDFTSDEVTTDMSLYAKWEKSTYQIQFMSGSLVEETRSLNFGDELGPLPNLVQEGYTFKGWYTLPSEGELVSDKTKVTEDTTYYARFEAKKYHVRYNLDEGTNHKDNPSTYTIETNTIILKAPSRSGYIFSGWTPTGEITIGSTEDKVFEASWQKADFKVEFDSQEGSSVSSVYAIENATITPPENPTKTGYTFAGWYKDASCSEAWNFVSDKVSGNTILYAKWKINTYKVEFVAVENGNVIAEIVETYGDTLKKLPNANREGYEFVGWFTKPSSGEKISGTTKVVKNTVYYGQWNIKKYEITYTLNGGINTGTNPSDYTIETNEIVLSSPTQADKAFIGWTFEGQSTPIKEVSIPKGSVGEKQFIANWVNADIEVTFDSQEGSDVDSYLTISGELVEKPTSPTRKGHTFAGWYKEENCVNEWNFNSDKVTADIKLYAKWTKNKYTIQFDTQGGSPIGSIQKEYEQAVGVLAVPTKEGYTFEGWYDAKTGGSKVEETTKTPENGATYYARWKVKTYVISYTLDGGNNHKDNPTTYTIESETITLKQPNKKDNAFKGWTYPGQTTPIKEVKIEKGNIGGRSYTANWVVATYTVTFDTQGGSEVETFYAEENDVLQQPNDPTRKGHTFKGWYKEATCVSDWDFESDTINENMSVYAKWAVNEYTVKFDSNGGREAVQTIKENYDTELGTLPTVTRKGYTFIGWYDAKTGGNKVETTTKMPENGATYYARWSINEYTATFDSNGGKEEKQTIKAKYDTELGTLPTVTRKGYTFIGWYDAFTGGNKVEATAKMPENGATYYARWKVTTYTISYMLDNGRNHKDNPTTYTVESDLMKILSPTKEGYEFIGWQQNELTTVEKQVQIAKGTVGDITLRAVWEKIRIPEPTPNPKPTPKPEVKPTPEQKEEGEQKEVEEEVIETTPGVERNPEVKIEAKVEDGKVSIPSDVKTNTSNGKTSITVGKGNIVVNISSNVEVENMEELVNATLSKEQLERIAAGANVEIRLNVKKVSTYDDTTVKQLAKEKGLALSTVYEVSITLKEDANPWIKVTQLNDAIEIVLKVEKKLQSIDAKFYAIRMHEGKATLLKDKDTSKKTVTVQTKEFSTYTISYQEKEGNNMMYLWILGGGLIIVGIYLVARKKKQ